MPIIFKYRARNISAKMFLEYNFENHELIKLRAELINTTNFNWLEKKIKNINAKDIRTADYYFQRMLIEHRIILEEYDDTKKQFSKILTENITQFNANSLSRLLPLAEKLKNYNLSKYHEVTTTILEEYKKEIGRAIMRKDYQCSTCKSFPRPENAMSEDKSVHILETVTHCSICYNVFCPA